jgi:hypothetical protein
MLLMRTSIAYLTGCRINFAKSSSCVEFREIRLLDLQLVNLFLDYFSHRSVEYVAYRVQSWCCVARCSTLWLRESVDYELA